MNSLVRDNNFVSTLIRSGIGIQGFLSLTADDLTANTWYRLMPNGNDGSPVTDEPDQLNIGTLRSDILTVEGWHLNILNTGNFQEHNIRRLDEEVAVLEKHIYAAGKLPADGVEYVIYPKIVNPFGINYAGNQNIDIGIALTDVYAPAASDIKKVSDIQDGKLLLYHFSRLDRIFYRFTTVTSGETYTLSWGEQYKS